MQRATAFLFCFAAVSAHGLTAQAQAAPQSNNRAIAEQSSIAATSPSPQCLAAQHFDPVMRMCMPKGTIEELPRPGAPSPTTSGIPSVLPSSAAEHLPDSAMSMAMSAGTKLNNGAMVRLNQFMVYSSTSGPRGQSRLTGPGMWMLTFDKDLSAENHLSVDIMGTPEHLTVGDKGTPQLLQTENVDAMHPHDYIMALELRDSLTLDADKKERLTFLLAPRGEAAIGPVPFMHRESAEGNPDAPLSHALQDGFHDVSTVLGVEYQFAHTTVEATAFSGHGLVWPLPLHRPDSYGVRMTQNIDDHLTIGASYADALLPEDTGGAEHNQFVAAWLSASYLIGNSTLKSSVVWGRGRAAHNARLNSFLEEAVYQRGQNKFYNRAEIVQITPAQLELAVPDGEAVPKWAGALTIGYERTVFEKNDLSLFVGGSYTKDFIPAQFERAYGSDPGGGKLYVRVAFHSGIH